MLQKLNLGFPWYNGSSNRKQKIMIIVEKNLKASEIIFFVPVQWRPSPIYPGLHVQTCDPRVLLQVAFTWHLPGYVLHSSISVKKKEKRKRKKREKNEKWEYVFIQESRDKREKSRNLLQFPG